MDGLLLRTLLTGALIAVGVAGPSQTTTKDAPGPAANAWMLTPTPYLEWNKDISPSVRAQRDAFWDKSAFPQIPLTMPGSGVVAGGGTDLTFDPFDISDVPNRAVLTATFTKSRGVLSASQLSLYTEVTLQVDQVFEDKTGTGRPLKGGNIVVLLYGGTVLLRSGETLSVGTDPRDLSLQPGHKYLLVLSYNPTGDFYAPKDNWDVSDGIVRPNTDRTRYLARAGRSSLSGIGVQQLGTAVGKALYASN